MNTPLYKKLRDNGTTIYAFVGADFDFNRRGNPNNKVYFSKFALLNLPVGQQWDFTNFYTASNIGNTGSFGDRVVNSLRNYVANQETVIRDTKISNSEKFYDSTILKSVTERVFFKWLKTLDLIDFDPAVQGDQYISDLAEFASNDVNDETYLPEFLWTERRVFNVRISGFKSSDVLSNKLDVEYSGDVNYKIGDTVIFSGVTNGNFPAISSSTVLAVIPATLSEGIRVVYDTAYVGSAQTETSGVSYLSYSKVVPYIGEIQGSTNVLTSDEAYDQVFAAIADKYGSTPDVLFRTQYDNNYAPSLTYPILPSQFRAEIRGAENSNSPINKTPANYVGDRFAQYDQASINQYRYYTSSGDINRRSGDYFGVFGTVGSTTFDSAKLDGIGIDFDLNHYSKANVTGQESSNFDTFNGAEINNEPPSNFIFNAVLWYYIVEDENGNFAENLYGISFLDNPANEPSNPNSAFPTYNKLVSTDTTNGVAYNIALNKHTSMSNEAPVYSSKSSNDALNFDLFSQAFKQLIETNAKIQKLIDNNNSILNDYNNLKQLLYTQTTLEQINTKFDNIQKTMGLLSTMQVVDSDTTSVEVDLSTTPTTFKINNITPNYKSIYNISTTNLYNSNTILEYSIIVLDGADILVNVSNNDNTPLQFDSALNIYLNKDLSYRQSAIVKIDGTNISSENKRLSISVDSTVDNVVTRREMSLIDLPVYFNKVSEEVNSASIYKGNINLTVNSISMSNDGEVLELSVNSVRGLVQGDAILINNLFMEANNFSGQYIIGNVDIGNNLVFIDYTQSNTLFDYITELGVTNGSEITQYNSIATITFNKGVIITITRVSEEVPEYVVYTQEYK